MAPDSHQLQGQAATVAMRWPVKRQKIIFAVLLAVTTLNYLDRQIVNILAESIKRDLHLSDTQVGAVTGLAFAVLYSLLGVPIARLAERVNRVQIISGALAIWSAFTALCALPTTFAQLALLRVGVGVGEAGCTPPMHALVADATPRERRASALAFVSLGSPIGALLGLTLGGILVPIVGWRLAFVIVGVPGILIALIALAVIPEVRTKRSSVAGEVDHQRVSTIQALRTLLSSPAYCWLIAGIASRAILIYGFQTFYASFFLRNHATGLQTLTNDIAALMGVKLPVYTLVGLTLGIAFGLFGIAGTILGGRLADRAAIRDERAYVLVPALALIIATPLMLWMLMTPHTLLALVLLIVPAVVGGLMYGPGYAAIQALATQRHRAMASAVQLLFTNLVGLGIGPLAVGFLSDALAKSLGEAEGLRLAMVALTLTGFLTAFFLWLSSRTIVAEIAARNAVEKGE